MGGTENVGPNAAEELQALQVLLYEQFNTWCLVVISSHKEAIWSHMRLMQEELMKLKDQDSVTRADAKVIVEIVLEALVTRASKIVTVCEKYTLVPKLIKELWLIVIEGFQSMLLPNLPSVTTDYAETLFHNINYNQKQCTLLELIIDLLKEFFMDGDFGIKESTFNRNVKQMKAIIKLFNQTTESLIRECLKTFKYDSHRERESFGELSLELSIARRPGSILMDGILRVISGHDIKPLTHSSNSFKIFVDFNFIFPNCWQFSKYKYSTGATSPAEMNHNLKFTLPPTECCQLQATVKHKQLIGGDQILGVTSVSLDSILKSLDVIMKTCVYTINLNRSLYHDERGRAFLTMLALRNSDEIAQDFVMLRTCRRLETD